MRPGLLKFSSVALAMGVVTGIVSVAAGQQRRPANRSAPAVVRPPVRETDPAVRTALETPRKTAREYVRAILWLVDLGRPELARPMMAELAKLPVTDAERAALVGEFGTHGMLRMAQEKELGPEAATFADACTAAAKAVGESPERIAQLVKQLSDGSAEVRIAARNDLAATGTAGAVAALEALAREGDGGRRAALVKAIELMHPLVDGPLLAMSATDDPQLRAEVLGLLGRLGVPQAAPLLANDPAKAAAALAKSLEAFERGVPALPIERDNQVQLWRWDDASKSLSGAWVSAEEAQVAWMARLTDEIARLRPTDGATQLRALVLRLESNSLLSSKSNAGQVDAKALAQADPRELSAALGLAIESKHWRAARLLVDALGAAGDSAVLFTGDGRPSPLAAALDSPDRRVRFAAARAIMTLDPKTPYPGASRIPDVLSWFARGGEGGQAVVAMPTIAAAGDLAGYLAEQQLAAEATNRGRDAVDMARSMADLELVLVDMNILVPDVRQVVYELRISPTTGHVPIGLLASEGRLDAAERIASEHTGVVAVSRPHTAEGVKRILDELRRWSVRNQVLQPERLAQALEARKWLASIAEGRRPFYTYRAPATPVAAPRPAADPSLRSPAGGASLERSPGP